MQVKVLAVYTVIILYNYYHQEVGIMNIKSITNNAPIIELKSNTVKETEYLNSIYNVDIDGVIQDTQQGNSGDCWLLTCLNTLRETSWGAKMIKEAIKKDKQGNIIITFKGSRGKQKEFKITAHEIENARKSGKYASGDDDVIAFELAVEKYLNKYGKEHGITNNTPENLLDGGKFSLNEFVELLSGKKGIEHCIIQPNTSMISEREEYRTEMKRVLDEIEKNPGDYAIYVNFNYDREGMYKHHAYQVKGVVTEGDKKYVILVNPWNSSEEEKILYDDFIANVSMLSIAENPDKEPNINLISSFDYRYEIATIWKNIQQNDYKVKSEYVQRLISITNENTVKELFKNKEDIALYIKILDRCECGWGHGEAKKRTYCTNC